MQRNPHTEQPDHLALHDGSLRAPQSGLSYVKGEVLEPLLDETVWGALCSIADRYGERPAAVFCHEQVRWTWKELRDLSTKLATALSAIGVEKGDRIGIWASNCPEWILTQFAAMELGAILVNLNPASTQEDVRYAVTKVDMKALVCAVGHKKTTYADVLQALCPELAHAKAGQLQSEALPSLRIIVSLAHHPIAGTYRFEELLYPTMDMAALTPRNDLCAHEPINIQFTSGTTGSPKAATLTHFNIINNAKAVAQAMRLSEEDRLCIPVPLFHCFGMVMGVLGCVKSGACMVFPGPNFNAPSVMKAIESERCTAIYGVPTMFIAQLNDPQFRSYNFSSLRTGIMAGAPCPIETMRRVQNEMNVSEITIAYGMTETSPVSFQTAANDPLEVRVNTVGRVLPHLEVKLVDASGEIVPVGTPGEIYTRGYSVMARYWGDPDQTAEAIHDGWMKTGDIAILDPQGYAKIVGRVKDMIIRGGEKIFPREIEECLFSNPKILAAQVFGVPSDYFGEAVAAWIILKPGVVCNESELRSFCRSKLPSYKIPRYIRFVDDYPSTQSGKPQKFMMRQAMCVELGLTEPDTA